MYTAGEHIIVCINASVNDGNNQLPLTPAADQKCVIVQSSCRLGRLLLTPPLKVGPTLKSDPKQSLDGFGDYGHI